MRITIAMENHIEIIKELLKNNLDQSTFDEYSQELLATYLENSEKFIIIGDVFVNYVGYIFFSLNKDNDFISIDEVVIDKQFLNRGYEERLLFYILEYAKVWGITNIKVNININNPDIVNVIIKYGFNYEVISNNSLKLKNEKI